MKREMKSNLTYTPSLFVAFPIVPITSYTQEGWFQQSSGTTFKSKINLFFKNENVGWIVGDDWNTKSGVILHTTNGGTMWRNTSCN